MSNDFTTLECLVQNRLGALDRVLGALTHRGILPNRMETFLNGETNTMCIRVEFDCCDARMVEKLVKFLEKQVYVMEVSAAVPKNVNQMNQLFVA
jgi:acetolactate synthase small subunit